MLLLLNIQALYKYLNIYLHSVMDSLATLANGADMFLEHCHNEQ